MGRSVALPAGNPAHPNWGDLTLAYTGHDTGEAIAGNVTNIRSPGTLDGTISGSITRNDSLGLVDTTAAGKVTFTQIDCNAAGLGFTVMFRCKLAALNTASGILGKGQNVGYIWVRQAANTLQYSPAASGVAGSSLNWTLTDANYLSQRDYCIVVEAPNSGGTGQTVHRLYQKATNETTWTLVNSLNSTATLLRSFNNVGEGLAVGSASGFVGEIEYVYIFKDKPLSATELNSNFSDPYDLVSQTSVTLTPQGIHQRVKLKQASGTINITLAGSTTGTVNGLEYRLGPSGTWQTLISGPIGSTFSQAISIPATTAFQGITIRAASDTAKTSTDADFTIADEIWLLAADSLSSGRLNNAQVHVPGTYKSLCYTSSTGWLLASDGVGIPNAVIGSHHPLFANLMRDERIICFIQTSQSGAEITGKRASAYTSIVATAQCLGISGMIATGGANDVTVTPVLTSVTSANNWRDEMIAIADSLHTQWPGSLLYMTVCPDVSQLSGANLNDYVNNVRLGTLLAAAVPGSRVRVGANVWWLEFTVDHLHPKTDTEARAMAEGNWAALRANASSTPSPKVVDAKHNAGKTVVTLRFDRVLKTETLSPNCFRVTDNGTPVTISTATAAGAFVTLTLASAATGTLVAHMGWGEAAYGNPPRSGQAIINLYGEHYRAAEPFYDLAVTPSDTTAPTLAAASVNLGGTAIILSFTEVDSAPILPVGGITGFTVNATGGVVSILAASRTDNTTVILTPQRVILGNPLETVTLNYSGGNITDSAETPNALGTINNFSVTNNSGATSGGGVEPNPSDLRFGVVVGSVTGTLRVPTASQTLNGVLVDNTTGNVVLPIVGNVRNLITFGPASGLTGTCTLPPANKVELAYQFGAGGTEFTGTLAGGGGSGGLTTDQWTVLKAVLGIPNSGTTPVTPVAGILADLLVLDKLAASGAVGSVQISGSGDVKTLVFKDIDGTTTLATVQWNTATGVRTRL